VASDPLVFVDSFNHYNTLAPSGKWDFAFNGSVITNASIARTGSRCCQVIGTSGPFKNIGAGQSDVHYNKLIIGVAMNFSGIVANSDILHFNFVGAFNQNSNLIVVLNTDGSISVYRGAGDTGQTLLGTSASKPFVFNPTPNTSLWNYIQVKLFVDNSAGSVEVLFAPPTGPMTSILTVTGVKTSAISTVPWTNQIGILANSGITQNCYFADFYCLDWSGGANYLGAVKIYVDAPFANSSPLQWAGTPGSNFTNVAEIPPDGDTSYNASATPGLVDQYSYNTAAVPPAGQIQAVQHTMTMRCTAGSRQVASVANGVTGTAVYLPNTYAMYQFQYSTNPATGLGWKPSDFPASFGPGVTA